MTDYHKDTGSSGDMMIRDTGSVIEFWLNSHNSDTFANQLPWGYTVNGTTNNSRQTKYSAGAGWVKFGSWTVTTDQTVTFRIFDTGTSGFGGPTTFSVAINRAGPPGAPSKPSCTNITATSVNVTFNDGPNNGAAVDSRQIGYSTTNHVTDGTLVASDGSTVVTGLSPGQFYNFWARTHNAKGYSPWSAANSFTTLKVPDAPQPVLATNATQTTFLLSFSDGASNGGSPITQRELAYGRFPDAPESFVGYFGVILFEGMLPGTTYYFWARVMNSAGWSPYSQVTVARTIAGARVNVGGVWKEAVPYVKVGSVWKLAQPYVRVAGEWKKGS